MILGMLGDVSLAIIKEIQLVASISKPPVQRPSVLEMHNGTLEPQRAINILVKAFLHSDQYMIPK